MTQPAAGPAKPDVSAAKDRMKKVELNTALHLRLMRTDGVRASTYESAMRALEELRRKRGS